MHLHFLSWVYTCYANCILQCLKHLPELYLPPVRCLCVTKTFYIEVPVQKSVQLGLSKYLATTESKQLRANISVFAVEK